MRVGVIGPMHPDSFADNIADCLPDLPHWHEPAQITEQATFLVVDRPGWALWPTEQVCAALRLPPGSPVRQQTVHIPLIGVSSRDLRRRVAERRSIRYLVPRSVECYIETHRLYLAPEGELPA